MDSRGRRGFLAAMGAAALAGCGGDGGTEEPDVEITVSDNKFEPELAKAEVGATVGWTFQAGGHTTAAYHPDNDKPQLRIPEEVDPWASGEVGRRETFTVTFDTEGVYDYYCANHEQIGMVGSLIVGEPTDADQPGLSEVSPQIQARAAQSLRLLNIQARQELGL